MTYAWSGDDVIQSVGFYDELCYCGCSQPAPVVGVANAFPRDDVTCFPPYFLPPVSTTCYQLPPAAAGAQYTAGVTTYSVT